MTYCLGIALQSGLVLASDSRSNAGVDQVQRVCKLALFAQAGSRVIAILSQGNLATTQSVITQLRQAAGAGEAGQDLDQARTMFDVASMVGDKLRDVMAHDETFVAPYGSADASFLVGGQIRGEPPRLFQIYSAGNFVEATGRSDFLQIGETKYGKPILDRALAPDSTIEQATKLALLSFDATVRSNLSVGLPIDILRYEAGSFNADNLQIVEDRDPYWQALKAGYGEGLMALVDSLPSPPKDWKASPAGPC
jgi:putative proteasome-type protease